MIRYASISGSAPIDGPQWALDLVREDLSGLTLPSRREAWIVLAIDEREALRTVEYHFGRSALWFRLERAA